MLTSSLRPIRLLLQLLTADQFIGERDKTTSGLVVDLKRQGNCGRLQIITANGSCVWRLTVSVVDAILALWSRITLVGLSRHSDQQLDYLAEQMTRSPERGTLHIRNVAGGMLELILWTPFVTIA